MTTQLDTIEKIQTGLTANYVPYWTVIQGLKEAMQNIAYGSIKSGKPAKLYFDSKAEMWAIKDKYLGFEKRHLYIGESEQREDEDGLGSFGEGWKIFLLVMARNNIDHEVDTVGFTFWGSMEPTPHGTEVLTINIKENDKRVGTSVYADVPEEDWRQATQSFAVLQGISPELTKIDSVLPDRKNELWVQGVRIEQEGDTNPLKLHFSYNLAQRKLINRDRSHVNTENAFLDIRRVMADLPEDTVEEIINLARKANESEDILRGPYFPYTGKTEQKKVWLNALANEHNCHIENLCVPSYNQAVNEQASRQGFVPLDTPRKWDTELQYLGIQRADDLINDRYDVVDEGYSGGRTKEEKSALAKAKTKLKKAFGFNSPNQLPEFRYVSEISNAVSQTKKFAHYDDVLGVIFLDTSMLDNEVKIIRNVLPEMIKWNDEASTTEEFERAYQQIILNLMGLK